MKIRIVFEWSAESGLSLASMYPFREQIEEQFVNKSYGESVSQILILVSCLENPSNRKKRYVKSTKQLEYDVTLDFFEIQKAEIENKKAKIKEKMMEVSEQVIKPYKFDNFDKEQFLVDLKQIVETIKW